MMISCIQQASCVSPVLTVHVPGVPGEGEDGELCQTLSRWREKCLGMLKKTLKRLNFEPSQDSKTGEPD